MPVEPQPRASLEPLLGSDERAAYSDDSNGSSSLNRRRHHHRRSSLESIDGDANAASMNRGLGELAPRRKDKAAVLLILGGLFLFLPGTLALILLSSPAQLGYFAPHAPLNALAITCFALGVVAVQPPTPPAGIRAVRLAVHQRVLLGIALPAMAAGTSFMYYNKHINNAEHYTTVHANMGCLTLLWMLVQAFVGAASVWGGGRLLGGGMKAKGFYKYHRISGYALIAFALCTASLGGGYSTWASQRLPVLRFFAYGVGVPLVIIGLAMRIRPEKMKLR